MQLIQKKKKRNWMETSGKCTFLFCYQAIFVRNTSDRMSFCKINPNHLILQETKDIAEKAFSHPSGSGVKGLDPKPT